VVCTHYLSSGWPWNAAATHLAAAIDSVTINFQSCIPYSVTLCILSHIDIPFIKPEGTVLCSQEPGTGPHLKPDESSSHPYFLLLEDSLYLILMTRGSSGSIVSEYRLDDRVIEVRSPTEAEDFSSSPCVQTGSGAHPASYPMGTGGSFPGGKARPGRDADHSPPSSAEIKNE
jgi:hypothetical protein